MNKAKATDCLTGAYLVCSSAEVERVSLSARKRAWHDACTRQLNRLVPTTERFLSEVQAHIDH